MLVRWALLLLFLWFAFRLQWLGLAITGGLLLLGLAVDLVKNRRQVMPSLLWGLLGGATVAFVSFGMPALMLVAFSDTDLVHTREGARVLVYLPGVVIATAFWILILVYRRKRA